MSGARPLALSVLAVAAAGCAGRSAPALSDADRTMLDAVPCGSVRELNSVYFRSGSANLLEEASSLNAPLDDASARLDGNVYLLARCPGVTVQIRGYAANREANTVRPGYTALSQRRADTVRAYYLRNGLSASRVELTQGMGQDVSAGPVYTDTTLYELDRQRNRRVDSLPVQVASGR